MTTPTFSQRALAFWRRYSSRILALLFSVGITAAILIYREELANLRGYGYLGVFLISVLGNATIILPVPSLAVVFAGGGVLNPLWVGVVAGLGEPIGELIGYMAGYGGSAVVENRERFERMKDWMQRRGFLTIFVLAAIPNPLFDLAGMTAGALRFPVGKFLLACWLGKTLKAFVIAHLGSLWLDLLTPLFG
ncbi:MAG TPA: VTT domain-containing protein [Chloroflexi bacterium]|nr:VTT domain-containing protein [Chloroflexota bacterium]